MLEASMHNVLKNCAPQHYPSFPAVRMLNPLISPELESILRHALMEDREARYQSYAEMQRDLKKLLYKLLAILPTAGSPGGSIRASSILPAHPPRLPLPPSPHI